MLVSSHEQQRLLIESALRRAGFEVSIASGRRSALRVVNENHPQVIIVDRTLPAIGGMLQSIRTDMDMPETSIISLNKPPTSTDPAPVPEIAADVNLQTPVVIVVLLAKIAELQKRLQGTNERDALIAGAIKMFPEQWLVYAHDEMVNLTEKIISIAAGINGGKRKSSCAGNATGSCMGL